MCMVFTKERFSADATYARKRGVLAIQRLSGREGGGSIAPLPCALEAPLAPVASHACT